MGVSQKFRNFLGGLSEQNRQAFDDIFLDMSGNADPLLHAAIPGKNLRLELEQLLQAVTQARAKDQAFDAEIAKIDALIPQIDAFLLNDHAPEATASKTHLQNRKALLLTEKANLNIAALETRLTNLNNSIQQLKQAGEDGLRFTAADAEAFGATLTVPAGPYHRGQLLQVSVQGNMDLGRSAIELIVSPPNPSIVLGETVQTAGNQATLKVGIPQTASAVVLLKVTVTSKRGQSVPLFKELQVV